jgi:hypothetical protein
LSLPIFAADGDLPKNRDEFGILIYENPANYKAEFEVLTPEATDIKVLIYDNQGNVLFSQNGSTQRIANANSLKIDWDLIGRNGRRVAAATYIVQATAKNANTGKIYQYFAQLGVRK